MFVKFIWYVWYTIADDFEALALILVIKSTPQSFQVGSWEFGLKNLEKSYQRLCGAYKYAT